MCNVRMWSVIMEHCVIGNVDLTSENLNAKNIDHYDKNNFDKHNKNDGVQTLHSTSTSTYHSSIHREKQSEICMYKQHNQIAAILWAIILV